MHNALRRPAALRRRSLLGLAPALLAALAPGLQPVAAEARPRAIVVAQLELPPPAPARMERRSVATPTIEAPAPGTAPMQGRPANDAPTIDAATVGHAALRPADTQRQQAIDRELQRLVRAAQAAQPIGSTVASAQAAWQLGLVYLHGAGVRQDAAQAQRWFEQAARFGREPWAYAGLAWCHIDGCVGPPKPGAAEREIALLRPRHPARADFLAWLLASRQPQVQVARPGVTPQEPPASNLPLLKKAAAAGDLQARIELGMDAVSQGRADQAELFFRQVAAQSPAAAFNLRELQARAGAGDARPPEPSASAEAAAALAQARKYHRGEGVPANFSEAIRFYRLAEQRGSAQAHKMLALIYSRPDPAGGVNIYWMQQLARVDPGSPVPTIGSSIIAHQLQREPTPLADLLPGFWRRQLPAPGA